MQKFYGSIKKKGASIGVYAREGWNEVTYGSDLDVFVEVAKDQYVWFPMQAKLLKLRNVYNEIYDPKAAKQQWEKLLDLKKIANCNPYYLLYNGNNIIKKIPLDNCWSKVKYTQFGCSLVEPEIVATVTLSKHPSPPKFDDFHPNFAQPWKVITCCPVHYAGSPTYTIYDIKNAMNQKGDKYKNLASFGKMNDIPINDNIFEGNGIINASREADWNPDLTFIVPISEN